MFVWVSLFRKRVVTASIGTYICGVLVTDGYLCSRVYGSDDNPVLTIWQLKLNWTHTTESLSHYFHCNLLLNIAFNRIICTCV